MDEPAFQKGGDNSSVVRLPGVDVRLTAEHALRAAIDNQVFANLRELERFDGGRAVQAVYVALIRRLPNVIPDKRRLSIDTGFSESSVKRAIRLLERSRLVVVERNRGLSSRYHLADIRLVEVASECVCAIRKMARSEAPRKSHEGRSTCDPAIEKSRTTSDPTSRFTCGERVGPHVTPKVAIKIQPKQQGAAVAGKSFEETLQRWGLLSASYLGLPGHKGSIAELSENPEFAAQLIDATMRSGKWSAGAGVGSKVAFLREHVPKVFSKLGRFGQEARRESSSREEKSPVSAIRDDEYERAAAEMVVSAMSDEEYAQACERLFTERPGLRKVYGEPDRKRLGLRILLAQALIDASDGLSSTLVSASAWDGRAIAEVEVAEIGDSSR